MKQHLKIPFVLLCILFAFWTGVCTISADDRVLEIDNYITDHAGVISQSTEEALNEAGWQFEQETGCQIVFITETSLGEQDIRQVAYQTFKEYGLGDADQDNGILLVVSIDDRLRYMEVGRGLEGVITDITSQHLQTDHLVPAFQEGDYDTGFTDLYEALISTIRQAYDEGELILPDDFEPSSSSSIHIPWMTLLPIAAILAGVIFYAYFSGRNAPRQIDMEPGETRILNYKGFDFTKDPVTISSSDENIVSVTGSGMIKAVGIGAAVITLQRTDIPKVKTIQVRCTRRQSRYPDDLGEALFWGSMISRSRRRHYHHPSYRPPHSSGGFRGTGSGRSGGGFKGGGGGKSRGGGAGGRW